MPGQPMRIRFTKAHRGPTTKELPSTGIYRARKLTPCHMPQYKSYRWKWITVGTVKILQTPYLKKEEEEVEAWMKSKSNRIHFNYNGRAYYFDLREEEL